MNATRTLLIFASTVLLVLALRGAALAVTVSCNNIGDEAGTTVATGGDFNGDGAIDIVVASPCATLRSGGKKTGIVEVYSGSDGALLAIFKGPQGQALFGTAAAFVGDIDGDGADELGIGSQGWDAGVGGGSSVSNVGRLDVFSLSSGLLYSVTGSEAEGNFGESIEGLPDATGDGVPDILVGAGGDGGKQGAAYLLSGTDGTIVDTSAGPNKFDRWGSTLAHLGDLDGDSIPEVVVASNIARTVLEDGTSVEFTGLVKILSGASLATELASFAGQENEKLGKSLAAVLDSSGQPTGDLYAGAPGFDPGLINKAGAVFLLSSTGAVVRQYQEPLPQIAAGFGSAVAALNDIDGDGVPDLVASAPAAKVGVLKEAGRVHALSGQTGAVLWTVNGERAHARLGQSLAGGADFNGDGYSDVVVGVPGESPRDRREAGIVSVRSGADGSEIMRFKGHRGTETRVFTMGWWHRREPRVCGFTPRGHRRNPRAAVVRTTRSGSLSIALVDKNGSVEPGNLKIAVGTGHGGTTQEVDVLSASRRRRIMAVFDGMPDAGYSGGVNVGAGNLDEQGIHEVVAVQADSSDGNVKANVFRLIPLDVEGHSFSPFLVNTFNVFKSTDTVGGSSVSDLINANGAFVRVGDLRGGVKDEMVVAPVEGFPVVRVFGNSACSKDLKVACDTDTDCSDLRLGTCENIPGAMISEWIAYAPEINSGVSVAIGDLDGDGHNEIVTVPANGPVWVKAFSIDGSAFTPSDRTQAVSFFAFGGSATGGARVAIADVDLDGKGEILVAPRGVPDPAIYAFETNGQQVQGWKPLKAYGPGVDAEDLIGTDKFLRP